MKRILIILLLIVAAVTAALTPTEAGRKNDNRPDGGGLNYGEYGRPATLDPITSNEMISVRLTELIFNGLVGINEKQEIVPELAEKWDRSADNRTYTFFLRKDVGTETPPPLQCLRTCDAFLQPFDARTIQGYGIFPRHLVIVQ